MDRNIYLSNSNFRIPSSQRAMKAVETAGTEKRQNSANGIANENPPKRIQRLKKIGKIK
jgi:hypothetical protein